MYTCASIQVFSPYVHCVILYISAGHLHSRNFPVDKHDVFGHACLDHLKDPLCICMCTKRQILYLHIDIQLFVSIQSDLKQK